MSDDPIAWLPADGAALSAIVNRYATQLRAAVAVSPVDVHDMVALLIEVDDDACIAVGHIEAVREHVKERFADTSFCDTMATLVERAAARPSGGALRIVIAAFGDESAYTGSVRVWLNGLNDLPPAAGDA